MSNGYFSYWSNLIHSIQNEIDKTTNEESRRLAQNELNIFIEDIIKP